jgi:spermidine/putrescine ABC transporter ATP-binding subunit
MSTVEVRGVTKHYGRVTALEDVSLLFAEGEFFGLLGPSGSGKTTLLRCAAGFIEPEAGDIYFDGQNVRALPVHKRNIGMVFQNYALFPHLSVFDNIAFGLVVRGMKRADVRQRVTEMLALIRLSGLEDRRPRQLSGGQQQRVALARALVTRPRVLLLDEPLGALDKRLRQEMQVELRQIQREVGITTIFVTHDQEEAMTLCDRIAIFNEGRVVQVGAPSRVYERPATTFAANFLGDANLFRGRVVARDGFQVIECGDGIEIATGDPLPSAGGVVALAVRPEKMSLWPADSAPAGAAGENRLGGEIVRTVYSGSSITYRLAVPGRELTIFEQNRSARPYAPGDRVVATWPAEHTVVVEEREK